jgi:flagellar FliL protein
MAESAAKPENETPAEVATAATAAAPARKLTLPLIIGAGLIIGGAAGALVLGPRIARARTATTDTKPAARTADSLAAGEHGSSAPEAPVHLIDNLVLNPAGSGGTRFLLASVGLQTTSAAAAEIVKKREVEARDVVLAVLGAKHVEDLAEIGNRERLKVELKVALDSLFGPGVVRKIYLPQFVIQ